MKDFSVIIPLYNKARYIARAIDSVLKQSFTNFEIVVIDDGSTDAGAEIVKKIEDPRIRLFQQQNAGVSAARNRGINEAESQMISFLDADDVWTPVFLQTIRRLINDHPHAGIYATAYKSVNINGVVKVPKLKYIPAGPWSGILPSYLRFIASGIYPMLTPSIVVPKNIFHKLGAFAIGKNYGEDVDMWIRISLEYEIAFSNVVGAIIYEYPENSLVRGYSPERDFFIFQALLNALKEGKINKKEAEYVYAYIDRKRVDFAKRCIINNNPKSGIIFLNDCLKKHSFRRYFWLMAAGLPRGFFNFMRLSRRIANFTFTRGIK